MRLHGIVLMKAAISLLVILLLLNLPFVAATEINLIFGSDTRTFSFSGTEFVSKAIEVQGAMVLLNITPGEGYSLRKVLLFPCRDSNPLECSRKKPIEYESYSDTYLNLEDVVKDGRGGILTLVMLNTTSWIGFWDSYENGAFISRDLNSLDLSINKDTGEAENLISEYGMIPVNWIDETDFKGRGLYQIEAEKIITQYGETLNFTRTLESGNLNTRNYLFAFPKDGRVYNPLTFYYQPPVECGNYLCELGESQSTCCRDCGCPENQTCSRNGCVPPSNIKLVLDSMEPQPPLECYIYENDCSFQDLLELELHIENAPLDYWINDYFFAFGNQSYKEMACIPDGNNLDCTLLMPGMNRSQPFQEKRVMSLYLSIGYMELSKTRTEELPLDLNLDIKGTDLGQELDLQSYRDKLAQMAKTMEKINKILKFVNTILMIYQIWTVFNYMRASTHKALAVTHTALAADCWGCCNPTPPGAACCACAEVNSNLAVLHKGLAASFLARAKYTLWQVSQAQIAKAIINAIIKKWVEYETGKLEDRLKQKMERIGQNTMSIVGDDMSEIIPLLVWANGSLSGGYTENVCNGETVEIWYDFTPLNCTGGLWLAPQGMAKQRVNETGRHMLLSLEAGDLFPDRNSMHMGVECNSTRYYNPVQDIIPFLNYTEDCGNVSSPEIELRGPANGTSQASRDITLSYSVAHPLAMSGCDIIVSGNTAQSRAGPERGSVYEFTLHNLLPGGYIWSVECEDILGILGSSSEYEFTIGGTA